MILNVYIKDPPPKKKYIYIYIGIYEGLYIRILWVWDLRAVGIRYAQIW